jgi:sec-independent protein translocase protein TatC
MTEGQTAPLESTRMTLAEHLSELRTRLVRGLIVFVIAFMVGWGFYKPLGRILLAPLMSTLEKIDADQVAKYEEILSENPETRRSKYFTSDEGSNKELRGEFTIEKRPITTALGEGFMFALKVSLVFACFVGGPFLLWQMWQFIAAGLYEKEQRLVMSYFPASVALFLGGILFGYYVVLPYGSYFLATAFSPEIAGSMFKLSEYFSFLTALILALGLVFQLPVIMFALVHVDLVERKNFIVYRSHFIVGAFVISAILTPPDPFTLLMMALPMTALYEVGIFSTRFIKHPGPAPAES